MSTSTVYVNGSATTKDTDDGQLTNGVKGSKPQQQADIRSFFTNVSGLKRKLSEPDEAEPEPKRASLVNGALDKSSFEADDDVVVIHCLDPVHKQPEVKGPLVNGQSSNGHHPGHQVHDDAVSGASVREDCSGQPPASSGTKAADLVAACLAKEVRIVLPKLETTEFFTEAVKKQLDQWREWKSWEGQDYEVEAIVDYSWCKRTVRVMGPNG